MKLRKNYFKILCSMLFCFTLGAVGCSNGDPAASSGDPGSTSLAPDEFVVTFNTKGGTAVTQQVVKAGNKVTKPQDPTQEYHIFTGWYWDFEEATPFDFESVTIASNTTIYAGWDQDHAALDNEPGGSVDPGTTAQVTFEIDRNAGYGKRLYLAGTFNNWTITNAWKLNQKSGSDTVWTGTFALPTGQVEFKFVISDWEGPSSSTTWEGGSNHSITVQNGMATQVVTWQYQEEK